MKRGSLWVFGTGAIVLLGTVLVLRREPAPGTVHPGSRDSTLPSGGRTSSSVDPASHATGQAEAPGGIAPSDQDLVDLKANLRGDGSPLLLIPILVRIEQALADPTSGALPKLEKIFSDDSEDWRTRALLAMLVGRYPGANTRALLLGALKRADGDFAETLVFALATRPFTPPFRGKDTEGFWVEGMHSPLFGESLFPKFHDETAGTPGAPKSFRLWHARIGHVEEGRMVTESLNAATRSEKAEVRSAILFMLRPPASDLAGLPEAVKRVMESVPDSEDAARALELLAHDTSEGTQRFLEEVAVAPGRSELRSAAAVALLRWDAPDISARLQKVYSSCQDSVVQQALLEKAYRADTPAVQSFLLYIVTSEGNAEVRKAALAAVGLTEPLRNSEEKRAILQQGLRDADGEVRNAAVQAVDRLKCVALREQIRALSTNDASEKVRLAATRTLAALR